MGSDRAFGHPNPETSKARFGPQPETRAPMSVISRAKTWAGEASARLAEALAALADTVAPAPQPKPVPVRVRNERRR